MLRTLAVTALLAVGTLAAVPVAPTSFNANVSITINCTWGRGLLSPRKAAGRSVCESVRVHAARSQPCPVLPRLTSPVSPRFPPPSTPALFRLPPPLLDLTEQTLVAT
jgi:hypothetical protein